MGKPRDPALILAATIGAANVWMLSNPPLENGGARGRTVGTALVSGLAAGLLLLYGKRAMPAALGAMGVGLGLRLLTPSVPPVAPASNGLARR